ncbi:hypothetical protein JTE90_015831 [Oedothorax gibbosus]|uniref:GST C-terminal domain-containing protein n=1 Tax=Oedothorax gibbosus TaxID=931172 RepID=A0AAV6U240_9ARAC|nr:hypothetical protein JTE90_015831 [Oedothorax gibbosus]
MSCNDIIYLSARLNKYEKIETTIETYICMFVYTYCELKNPICFIDDHRNYCCEVSQASFKDEKFKFIPDNALLAAGVHLVLPAVKATGGRTFIAGICAVLRWVIKANLVERPNHYSEGLLGFRGGCLVACTESSLWTKFCELEMPNAVSKTQNQDSIKHSRTEIPPCLMLVIAVLLSLRYIEPSPTEIPPCLMLVEAHLQRPVRTHNILKRKLDIAKEVKKKNSTGITIDENSKKDSNVEFTIYDENSCPVNGEDVSKALEDLVITEKSEDFSLHHNYLEGIDLTLADMIVFPCVHYLLKLLSFKCAPYLPHVVQWYKRMLKDQRIKSAAETSGFSLKNIFNQDLEVETDSIVVPEVDKDSLYKRDPSYTKMKIKQKSPSRVLQLLKESNIHTVRETGYCTRLEWEDLPPLLHPAQGDLPQKRIERKCQQIESMVSATLKVAVEGQTIVEFCAGGGHVGLLLAYLLPNCKVILIENKESSMSRAISRAEELKLENIYFYQCNLDYFKGSFDLGIALHACGVATDLVIQQCIQQSASFVCCPCCYGGIQNTHLLRYPLSKKFRDSTISYEQYTLLARCADRTEVNTPTAEEGETCMGLVDTDRVHWAEENGYDATLTHLNPLSCSTKHNLLIGRSPKWKCKENK